MSVVRQFVFNALHKIRDNTQTHCAVQSCLHIGDFPRTALGHSGRRTRPFYLLSIGRTGRSASMAPTCKRSGNPAESGTHPYLKPFKKIMERLHHTELNFRLSIGLNLSVVGAIVLNRVSERKARISKVRHWLIHHPVARLRNCRGKEGCNIFQESGGCRH